MKQELMLRCRCKALEQFGDKAAQQRTTGVQQQEDEFGSFAGVLFEMQLNFVTNTIDPSLRGPMQEEA